MLLTKGNAGIVLGLMAVAVLLWAMLAERPAEVYEYRLDNGLKILVQPDRRSPVVVSQVWYKVGSGYEPAGITGISHMLEHMMFKGTDELKPSEFSAIIAANGGEDNAFTSYDYTTYFQRIASDRLELCFKLEADRMRDLIIDEQELTKERDVVAEERRWRYDDNPQSLTLEKFMATAYPEGPYHHPVIGWMDDIQSFTTAAARDWYRRWYAPNNATLVVVGDVEPEAVHELAEKYFGPLQPSSDITPAPSQPADAQTEPRYVEVKAPAKLPYVLMGYKVPSLMTAGDRDEAYALEVLSGVLDGGSSARLSRDLLRGKQLAASAGASYDLIQRLDGFLSLNAVPVAGVTTEQLIEALKEEVARLQQEPVSETELSTVRAQVVASDVYQRDSVFYQAMELGTLETTGVGWQVQQEYINRVEQVTPQQIQAVARKYLTPERLTVAVLIPQDANAKISQSANAKGAAR
ncbi:MAG TPA: pitrilysin family protein [Gammaproteobacteria bacterium]|nr:pitrilysin family protein [Gammaproteobacteria bacterium]